MCLFRGRIYFDTRVILKLYNNLLVLSQNSIHYASFGISVCRYCGRIYSFASVNLKMQGPCEDLLRIWKIQNSPHLLPWIYSLLGLKYAEQSQHIVFEIDFPGPKALQKKNCILRRIKETATQKNCKGAKEFWYTKIGSHQKEQSQFK